MNSASNIHTSSNPVVWEGLLAHAGVPLSVCIFRYYKQQHMHYCCYYWENCVICLLCKCKKAGCSTKDVKLLKLKRWGLTDWLLTSHSPHWVAWTARGADSVAPVPRAAPDSCDAVPPLVHHLSSSASRSPPWSHAAHCEAPDTDLPTANGPAVAKHYSWMCHDLGCIIQEATASLTTWVYW